MTLKEKIEKLEKQVKELEVVVKEAAENLLSTMSNYQKQTEANRAKYAITKINTLHNVVVMLKSKKRS